MATSPSVNSSSTEMFDSRQAAMKNRIITHLNNDHTFSLQLYLRHFCGVPEPQASNAKIVDVTTDHMIIESRAGRNLIPFQPPMKSLMETRERTVAMHNQSMAGLELSKIRIDTFALPNRLWQILTCAVVAWCVVSLPFRSKLLPSSGSLISKIWSIGGLTPGLASLAHTLGPYALASIFIIHTLEAENFARTRLQKHQVPAGSRNWWLWLAYVWFGGVACFTRFDELVRRKEDEMKKTDKH